MIGSANRTAGLPVGLVLSLGLISLAVSGCSLSGSSSSDSTPVTSGPTDVVALCAVVAEWTPALSGAEGTGLAELTQAKLGYFEAVKVVAPSDWADNIETILPAWQTLDAVIEAADGDASRIDFDAFQRDFAEGAANDAAFATFTGNLCG